MSKDAKVTASYLCVFAQFAPLLNLRLCVKRTFEGFIISFVGKIAYKFLFLRLRDEDTGLLAQLVQSAALTEQRSLVRAQYSPLFIFTITSEIIDLHPDL